MNVSLTPELEGWIQSKVETGLYKSSSEVVRDALRILHQYEEERLNKLRTLRSDLQTGLEQFKTGRSEKMNSELIKRIKKQGTERLHG